MTEDKKQSILEQIKIVEDNVSRLKTLVECDLHSAPDTSVVLYCCQKATMQLQNIEFEFISDTAPDKQIYTHRMIGENRKGISSNKTIDL